MKKSMILAGLVLTGAGLAQAETVSAVSPDGLNEIRLEVGGDLRYSVLRGGRLLVAPTPIGLVLAGGETLGSQPKLTAKRTRAIDETIATPLYKKASVKAAGNETVAVFDGGYEVALAAFDDGVAYRWQTCRAGTLTVIDEIAGLNAAADFEGIFAYNNGGYNNDPLQCSWENLYETCRVSTLDPQRLVYFPVYLTCPGAGVLVAGETDLADYPGLNFRPVAGKPAFQSWLARFPDNGSVEDTGRHRRIKARLDWIARTNGTRAFPWRTFTLAASPAKLLEADLNYKLAGPSKLADIGWIRPGKVAWDWWNDWNVYGVDFVAGCNTATYKFYIDFAAKNGIEYVILDEGWSQNLKIMELSPEVDLPALLAYGKAKGVDLILWAAWPQLVGRQEEVLSHYAAMGVKGFKIDFIDRDDQEVVNYMEKTAEVAAKYRLLVDYHGVFKPAGIQRRWPNVINFEGVYGLEQTKWGEPGRDFMRHDCLLPFIRMVAGPMDYTPGAMKNQTRKGFTPNFGAPASQGTRVHQMALLTLFEAPLQMLCASPSNYLREQPCVDFMGKIPTVWDETVGLAGEPGKLAAIARRKGDVWHVAVIGDWQPRTLSLPLQMLGAGSWQAEIFKDGLNAHREPTDWARETATVTAATVLDIRLAPGGGWTARISQ